MVVIGPDEKARWVKRPDELVVQVDDQGNMMMIEQPDCVISRQNSRTGKINWSGSYFGPFGTF